MRNKSDFLDFHLHLLLPRFLSCSLTSRLIGGTDKKRSHILSQLISTVNLN